MGVRYSNWGEDILISEAPPDVQLRLCLRIIVRWKMIGQPHFSCQWARSFRNFVLPWRRVV